MKLLQVVPRLPPPDEGVGGTAVALAERLAEAHGISTRFVVPSAFRPPSPSFDEREFPIDAVEPTESALAEILVREAPAGPVLLHYANYGYEARGCPHWLVEGLRTWRAKAPAAPLTTLRTMFHEVYASGPIWRSSFWLGRTQKRLAAETARLSTSLATGLEKYAALIRALPQVGDLGAIDIRPIFSGVGEPLSVAASWAFRPRRLVVFGGSGVRGRSYGPFADELAAACAEFATPRRTEIIDAEGEVALIQAINRAKARGAAVSVVEGARGAAVGLVGAVELARASVLLTRLAGEVKAYPNACAHLGMPLEMAEVSDGVLTCSYHGFRFRLDTGECLTAPEIALPSLAVRVERGRVQVRVTS